MSEVVLKASAPSPVTLEDFSGNILLTEEKEALRIFKARREDPVLTERVREALGKESEVLTYRKKQPQALLFRQLATPTHEILLFLKKAAELNLEPLILEYHADKFVSARNRYKRGLGKLPVFHYTDSKGHDAVTFHTIFDFNAYTGESFVDIECTSGEGLIHFHHRLLKQVTGIDSKEICIDGTQWFKKKGGAAIKYYKALMILCIRDFIMFENYEQTHHLAPFMREVIVPAFHEVWEEFGVRPLITRLLPREEETRMYWDAYPKKTETLL